MEEGRVHPFLTKRFYKQYLKMQQMNHVQIDVCIVYWGILYMSMNAIAAKFVVLLLDILIDCIQYLLFGIVTLILFAVRLVVFLITIVLSVTTYPTLGIVIPTLVARFGSGLSLLASVAYCVAASLALKIFACTVQQQIIVSHVLGVNSAFTRAMRIIVFECEMILQRWPCWLAFQTGQRLSFAAL